MTPEQRLDRAERILLLTIQEGRRARKEWNEKVNILINAQIATEEGMKRLTHEQTLLKKDMRELAREQKLTSEALRNFLDRSRKNRNGES